MIKIKLIVLAFALVLTAALTARAGGMTDAYFSDSKSGTITGTLGSWAPPTPCTFVAGMSKARHWDLKEEQSPRVLFIAQFDAEGRLYLDFGDESPGNSNSSPDVFRIVSHDVAARRLSFVISGPVSSMISQVELSDHTSVLDGGATDRVRFTLRVPKATLPGEYAGELIVWVEGSGELRIRVMVTVKSPSGREDQEPGASTPPAVPTAAPSPTSTPGATPSPAPGSGSDRTPVPTPVSTPTDTP